jgi:hypothetical protein
MGRWFVALTFAIGLAAAPASAMASSDQPDTPPVPIPQVQRGGLVRVRTPDEIAEMARANAAVHTGLSVDQISVVSIQPVEWSSFALGCPQVPGAPHFASIEVTIPGYIVLLDAAGTPLSYHTDSGLRAIPCDTAPPATTESSG